jgi:hypothetical protein
VPEDWRVDEVMNQVRFRDFNEWIKASNERLGNHRPMQEYICECSDGKCRELVLLSTKEYEDIRSHGSRFLVAPNHENPEVDQILSEHERFTLTAKLPGLWEHMAVETDPRK